MSAVPAAGVAIIPAVTKVATNIIRILGCNPSPMTLQGTNTYLIGSGAKRILLDAGDADKPSYIEHLKGVLRTENASIETILLTHWHHDHIGGVGDVLRAIDGIRDCNVWKFPRTDAPDHYPAEIPASVKLNHLSDGQQFTVDGATVQILYTPGHTTDHVVVSLKEDNSLFSGDCILGEGTAVFEDLFEYMRSLQLILDRQPSRIFPAHGNIIDDPVPKIRYYITHRNQREAQLLAVLRDNPASRFTELQLVAQVYKETPRELWPAAAFNVHHHLRKMTREGLLDEHDNEEGDGGHVWQAKPAAVSSL